MYNYDAREQMLNEENDRNNAPANQLFSSPFVYNVPHQFFKRKKEILKKKNPWRF